MLSMRVQVLHIDECPNWREAGVRVEAALRALGATSATVEYRLIENQTDAINSKFAGSPTISVDGQDLFPSEGATADLACRVYFTPDGLAGMPTQAQIRHALEGLV